MKADAPLQFEMSTKPLRKRDASGAVFGNILKGILREILQVFGGHIVFDIVPGEVGVDDGVRL